MAVFSGCFACNGDKQLHAWHLDRYRNNNLGRHVNGLTYSDGGDESCTRPNISGVIPSCLNDQHSWKFFAVGPDCGYGISETGSLWGWGRTGASYLGLGNGHYNGCTYPIEIKSCEEDIKWKHVSTCSTHTLAISESGELYAWGKNDYGQLGISNRFPSLALQPRVMLSGTIEKIDPVGYQFIYPPPSSSSLVVYKNNTYAGSSSDPGSGLEVDVEYSYRFAFVTMTNPGSGYSSTPSIIALFESPIEEIEPVDIVPTMIFSVSGMNIENGGDGYTDNTSIVFSLDAEGNAAIGRCIVSDGKIEDINILYGGKYNSAPTFEIYGNGSGTNITPVITGYIDTITLNGNGNYIQYSGTGLSIVSSGGDPESAAIFDAIIFGSVSDFIIHNGGQGYTCAANNPLMLAIENGYQYTNIGQCTISGGAGQVVEQFTLNERFLISTIPKNDIRLDYGGFYTNGSIIEPFTTNLPLPYLPAYGATLPPTLGLQPDQTEWVTDITSVVPSASIIFTDGTPPYSLSVVYDGDLGSYSASLSGNITNVKHGAALKVDYPSYEWRYTEYAMSGHQARGLYVNPNPYPSRYVYLPFERPEGTSSTGSWDVIDLVDDCGSILLLNSQVFIEAPLITPPPATVLEGEGDPEIIIVDRGENFPPCTGERATLIYDTRDSTPYPDGSKDEEKIPNYLLDFSNIIGTTPRHSYITIISGYGPNGPVRQNSYPELSLVYEQFGSNMGSGLEISHNFETIESGDYLYTYLDFSIFSNGNNYNEEPQFTATSYPLSPIKVDTSGLMWKEVSVTENASIGLTESGQLYWWGNIPAQNVWEPKPIGFTTNIDISGVMTLNPYGDYFDQYGLKINKSDIINSILPETPGYFNYNADNLPFTISDDIDPGNSYIGGPFDLYTLDTNYHAADIANFTPGIVAGGGTISFEEYNLFFPSQSFSIFLPAPPYHEGIGSYVNPVTLEIYNTTADFKKTFLCSSNSRLSDPNIDLPGVTGYINKPSSFKKIFTSNEGYLCAIDSNNQLWSLSNNFPNINNKAINYDTVGIYAYSGYCKAEWTWPLFVVDGITQTYWDFPAERVCTSDGPYSVVPGITLMDTKTWSQATPGRPTKAILDQSANWELLGTRFIGNNIIPVIMSGGSGYCIDDTFYIEVSGSRLIVSPYNIQRSGYVSGAMEYISTIPSPEEPFWVDYIIDDNPQLGVDGFGANIYNQEGIYYATRPTYLSFENVTITLTEFPEVSIQSFVAEVRHNYPSYNIPVSFNINCDVKIYNGKIIDIIMPDGFTFADMNVDAYGLGPIEIKSNSGKGHGAYIEFLPAKNTNAFPYKVTQRCESLGITITEDSGRINSCFFADMYDDIYSTYRPDVKLPIYGPSIKKLNGHLAVVYNSGENNLYDFQGIAVGNEPPTLNPIINTSFVLNNKGKNYSNIIPNITIDQPSDKTAVCDVFINGKIVSVGIDKGGRGFTSPPNVIFDYNPFGDTAEGDAVIEGPIGSIDLIIPGSGYGRPPSIRFSGVGIPAKAVSHINENGIITNIDILDGGLYRTPPAVEFYQDIIAVVEASAQCILDGSVIDVNITNSGSMYQSPPDVIFEDSPLGITAEGDAVIEGPIDSVEIIESGLYRTLPTVAFNADIVIADASGQCILDGSVIDVNITHSGSMYQSSPNVTFDDSPLGDTAEGDAIIEGPIDSVEIIDGGLYRTLPTVEFNADIVIADASAECILNGSVIDVNITNSGSMYQSPPNVTFDDSPLGITAQGDAIIEGPISTIEILDSGNGYATAPNIRFNGPGISAIATSTIDGNGSIDSIAIIYGGLYQSIPIIEFYGAENSGVPASATCSLDGSVIDVNITNPGSMYQSPPNIIFGDSPLGITAEGDGIIEGPIDSVEIIESGLYRTLPTVEFNADIVIADASGECILDGSVIDVNITHSGSMYQSSPNVTFDDSPLGDTAEGDAIIEGPIDSVEIIDGGLYRTLPTVEFNADIVIADASAECILNGSVIDVNITNSGSMYQSPPDVTFDDSPLGITAEGDSAIEGPVDSIDLIIPGIGYARAPSIRFIGAGIPAEAISSINENGTITNIDILDGGLYETPPTVEFYEDEDIIAVEASGQCILDGSVIYINITNSGSMYQYPPKITIRDNNIEEEELRQKLIFNEITQKEYDESIYTAIAQCRISGPIDHIDVVTSGRGYSKVFNDIITNTNVFDTTNKLNYDLYKDIFSSSITSNPFNDRLKNYIPSKARIYGLYDAPPWIYGTTSEPLIEVEFDINIENTGCYGGYGSISNEYIINNSTHSQWGVEFTGSFLQKPQVVFLDTINILPHEVSNCKITSYGLRSNQDIVDVDSYFLDGYYGGGNTDGSWIYYYRDILRLTNFTDKRIGFGDNESQNYKTYDKLKMPFDHSSGKTFDILDFKFDESYPILFELRDVTGSGALLEVNLDENHKFDNITFSAQGSGYSEKSYLELIQAKTFFEPCEVSGRINSEGFIESILILSPGEGYFDNPIIQISGSQGSGAVAKVILDGGIFPRSVSNILIENSGSGYDPNPSNPPIISIINSTTFKDTEFFSNINNTLKNTEFLDLFSWSTAQFEYGTYNIYGNNLKLLEHQRKAGIYDDISQNIKAPLTRIWDADYYSSAVVPVQYMTMQNILRSDDTSYSYDYENDKDRYIRIMDIFFTFDKIERINAQYTIIRDPYYETPSAVIVDNSEISPSIQPEIINWDTNITTSHNGTIYAYPSGLLN